MPFGERQLFIREIRRADFAIIIFSAFRGLAVIAKLAVLDVRSHAGAKRQRGEGPPLLIRAFVALAGARQHQRAKHRFGRRQRLQSDADLTAGMAVEIDFDFFAFIAAFHRDQLVRAGQILRDRERSFADERECAFETHQRAVGFTHNRDNGLGARGLC